MKIVSSFFVLFLIEQVVSKSDRVKLKDVQVLTLQKGKYTEARRSRPMHQLMCVGGTARCSFIPETVQCYNRGWDGRTVNWECKADLNKKYSFGLLEVNCEGYEHPDDDYILAGSCGLEFTINVADGVPRQRNFNPPPYLKTMTPDYSGLAQSILIIILVFGALSLIHLSYVYNTTTSPDYFGNPPIKLTRKKPPTPGSFHSSNERKVKLDKKSMSLVGSLITAPPSDKSKLTIPKPIIDCSDRRHIQPNRPASSMATNRLKSAAGNDEIPSSSKKREFLYTGKVRSTTPLSIQFETNKPSYNHKINLIKEKNIPPVNAVKNLGNLGTVLLASGQLGQINKSKITRIPLEPLDYETELDKNHSDNGMDKHKQPSPYEMSPFAYIEAVSENVENSSDSHPYYPRTSANQMVQTEKPISKPNENIYVTPSTSTDYSGYKRRNGIKNHDIQTKYELPHKSVSSSTENRRNSQIKYDYGHFGERMVPLRSSDITRTTTTTTTTTTEPPITAATNQPTEPSNVYFDDSVTPNSNEALDSELETVKENEIDGKVTSSTADPLIEGSLISGSTANPWSWDDTASENDGLLVSPLFASSNDEDDPNHEIQRNQQSHHETTTANYYAAEQPIEDNNQANSANERTAFTKSPDSGDSNGRDTTRYYFPFELKYLAELCKNNSAFGLSSFSSTTTSTSTTTPMPTTEPVEELTLEKSQVDQATLSYGDRPFAIGSIRGQKSGYNMKKVAYQYKQWGDQWMRSTQSDAAPRNERRQRKLTSPPLNRAKPQTTTTIASDDDYFFELSTLKPTTEESSVIKNEEAMKTARPILKHEYHYEPPFPDHGSHGEPIGANLFDEIDLKATETTDPAESHSSSDKSNDGVSFDEDKNIFENFDSEVPVSRIRPDNEEINDKQPTNPKIKKLNQKLSAPPSVAPASQTTAVQSSPKRYPASKTLQNSGGLSSSILDELAGIPGGAGRDYPALPKIPEEIDFSCKGRTSGFYADMNLRCQVYHHCNHGSMQSFMCPNGTIFNQEISVCSWWFNVDCGKSEQFYKLNDKPAPEPTKPPKPIPINVSEASINSSRRPKKNRIIYKQTPALEESFFREKPRSYSTTTNTFYINRNRRRHRYHHHHNRDDMFPFF